jgi:hypothetical protein
MIIYHYTIHPYSTGEVANISVFTIPPRTRGLTYLLYVVYKLCNSTRNFVTRPNWDGCDCPQLNIFKIS